MDPTRRPLQILPVASWFWSRQLSKFQLGILTQQQCLFLVGRVRITGIPVEFQRSRKAVHVFFSPQTSIFIVISYRNQNYNTFQCGNDGRARRGNDTWINMTLKHQESLTDSQKAKLLQFSENHQPGQSGFANLICNQKNHCLSPEYSKCLNTSSRRLVIFHVSLSFFSYNWTSNIVKRRALSLRKKKNAQHVVCLLK